MLHHVKIVSQNETSKILSDSHFQSLVKGCLKIDEKFFSTKGQGFRLLKLWRTKTNTYGVDLKAMQKVMDAFLGVD